MKITDLKIGQFATRNWHTSSDKSLCVKRYNLNNYEYWKNGQRSSVARDNSSIYKHNDFKLCDHNGKLIEEFTYPLYMENIVENLTNGRVVKFVSLAEGTVIIQGNSTSKVGESCSCWIEHTSNTHWKPYDFSKAPEIEDLDYWDARYNAGLPVYFSFNHENHKTCYKANLLPSVLFKDNKNIKFHIFDESKPEFTYPMYFECIRTHGNQGMIVKFETIELGQIVKSGKKLGATKEFDIKSFTRHTDQQSWNQVDFDETIGKIIPTQDDIDELISDLKSIIEDDDNRFSPSEYGAGTQLRESGYDQCRDLIDEYLEKYHITKAPDIEDQEDFKYYDDLVDIIEYIKGLLSEKQHKQNVDNLFGQNPFDEYVPNTEQSPCYLGIDYASQPDILFIPNEKAKSRLHDDALDAFSYAQWNYMQKTTGATENVANNLNKTKEFTMTKELQEAILELIATNGKPKVKKPKTPKIVCNVEGTLMEFADEAALKAFMWSSRVESVIRYDLSGKVTVPFELSVEAPKKQKQTKVTE